VNPRIVVPDSKINASLAGPITIDQIEMDSVSIPKATLKGFVGDFEYLECIAHDVHISVKLTASLDFNFKVSIDYLPDPTAEGRLDFHQFTQEASLGDIRFTPVSSINGEKKVTMTSDEDITMGPMSMDPDPIGNGNTQIVKIGNMKVEDIKMKCTEVPLPNPLGIFMNSYFPVQNPMDPNDVLVEETQMKKLESTKIETPPVTIKNITSTNIKIPSIKTNAFTVFSNTVIPPLIMDKHPDPTADCASPASVDCVDRTGDGSRAYFEDDHNTSTITLNIKEVTLAVNGGLEFKQLVGSVKASSATSENFDMDLKLKGMKIKGLNICGMSIPELMVEF
jgi:hypothetical protein